MTQRNSAFKRISPVERSLKPKNVMDRLDALERTAKRQEVHNVVVNYVTDLVNGATYPTNETIINIITNVNYPDNWQNVFVFDEFVSPTSLAATLALAVIGELGWLANADAQIGIVGVTPISTEEHYGIIELKNAAGTDGYITLSGMLSPMFKILQFVIISDAMIDAGDGCIFGVSDTGSFEIDGSIRGIYFRREQTEANWHAVTTHFATTDTDTGVPFVDGVWYLFEIKQPSLGTIEFYINRALVATHTTDIDTSDGLSPIFGMKDPGSTLAWGIELDYFAMQLMPVTQRWD